MSAWGNSWGSSWGNSWGNIGAEKVAGRPWDDTEEKIALDDMEVIELMITFLNARR